MAISPGKGEIGFVHQGIVRKLAQSAKFNERVSEIKVIRHIKTYRRAPNRMKEVRRAKATVQSQSTIATVD